MRNGTFYDRGGDRWYRDPINASKTYAGVTSVLKVMNKEGLNKARIKGVAKHAARQRKALAEQNQGTVEAILLNQDAVLPDWTVGRDFGTNVHQVIENIISGRSADHGVTEVEGTPTYEVSNAFAEWVPKCWGEFVEAYKFEPVEVEQTVVSEAHRYAGSFDLLGHITTPDRGRHLALVDAKSNKNGPQGFSVAIQNTAYGRAESIIDMDTGTRRDMPRVEASYVLWLQEHTLAKRPGWNLLPLEYSEETWRIWYAHLLLYAAGKREHTFMGEALNGAEQFKRWIPNN